MAKLDQFVEAYCACALWSSYDESTPEGGVPMDDNYSIDDIAPETLKTMLANCAAFREDAAEELADAGIGDAQAGHDFWLTRNGHGAGFWDRGLGTLGDTLTAKCKPYGSFDLYVGDDGKIHGQ
jgi:hypothetical protein